MREPVGANDGLGWLGCRPAGDELGLGDGSEGGLDDVETISAVKDGCKKTQPGLLLRFGL